jgi:hypothetical protein
MKTKSMTAFGHIVYMCSGDFGDFGEVLYDQTPVFLSHAFIVNGEWEYVVKDTGNAFPEKRKIGSLNTELPKFSIGEPTIVRYYLSDNCEWFCLPKSPNDLSIPELSSIVLPQGKDIVINNHSNIFLVKGDFLLNNKTFVGPCEIRVRSDDIIGVAKTDVYALRFPENS